MGFNVRPISEALHITKLLRMVNVSLYNIKINHWARSAKVFDNIFFEIFN